MRELRILLLEDNQLIGRDVKKILEFVGYKVSGPFDKGEKALEEMRKEQFDLAVLDIELQGQLSGIDVGKHIRDNYNIPIIFITGLLQDGFRQKAMEMGAHSFINKPFNERNLVNAIDMAFNASTSDTPSGPDMNDSNKANDHVFVKVNKRFIRVAIDQIDFLEASGHYMVMYLGEEQISSGIGFSEFLSKNVLNSIVRVHRSYAVNINRVTDFDDTHIYFSQKMVPISESYKKAFRKRISVI
mgnify:CR=1 FL=1